ncbi:L-fucose/L-arabinose isomerase family protein [Atrimonas thermophila]
MKQTFGLIVGNRGFFPDALAKEGREQVIKVLEDMGYGVVTLTPEDTKFGTVETWEDARKCARLFEEHRNEISGVIVTLPNFGDEKGVAYALRFSGLRVPILVHAFPDQNTAMDITQRRDSFCGKLSVCNNLKQFGIPFSLTTQHTENPDSELFKEDVSWFAAVCRVVNGFKNLKAGAIGARPNAFNTVRFSEKILEHHGISVEVADLSEIFARVGKLADNDSRVLAELKAIKDYIDTTGIPEEALVKMAKLRLVLKEWIEETGVSLISFQCWTSIQENLGIMPCTVMSMLSESLIPAACEVDLTGGLAMYALQLASGTPSALVDWNNNFNDDPDKAVLFHCSNFPKSLLQNPRMGYGDIISSSAVPKERAYGTCYGKIPAGPVTISRLATDDVSGKIVGYVAEGEITDDTIDTFGGWGVVKIENLQNLLYVMCDNGFEHHAAMNLSWVADALVEAFEKYLGFDIYWHNAE